MISKVEIYFTTEHPADEGDSLGDRAYVIRFRVNLSDSTLALLTNLDDPTEKV